MEIILSILFAFTRLLDFLTSPIYYLKARNKREYLPPIKNDMLMTSATELADKIRKRQVSSEEICQMYIERIKDVNPILNAVVQDRFQEAQKEAKQVDSYMHTTSLTNEELKKIKPLLGVPITIKECCSVRGMSFSVGLKSRVGFTAESDGEIVARIRNCGAIILLVSTTPELSLSWETFSFVNGYTKNPYDSTCSTGGSSGGEGALLGAGASLMGIGSDIAGSIRLPALFNGVFGHKPTPRIISIKGHWPIGNDDKYNDYLVIGPLTRYAKDLRLMMMVMCGNQLSMELKLNEPVDFKKLNIFSMQDVGFRIDIPNVSEDIKSAVNESVKHLKKSCGATTKDFIFEDFKYSMEICVSAIFGLKDIPNVMKWEKLGTNGIIILPTFHCSAFKHHQMYFKNGHTYPILASALGLPATSIPCGFDKHGLPIGIQVIAGPKQDRLCLAVAEELERHFGGWSPPHY